jgi:hypothetical protein
MIPASPAPGSLSRHELEAPMTAAEEVLQGGTVQIFISYSARKP